MLRQMDGPVLIGALLGITCVVSRPMLRAFGSGSVAEAEPAPWRRSRLEDLLSRYDWELLLGLRYERRAVAGHPPVAKPASSACGDAMDDDSLLLESLEAELVRATVQSVLDGLAFVPEAAKPIVASLVVEFEGDEEELIPVPVNPEPRTRFAVVDASVGQPIGAPDWSEVAVREVAPQSKPEEELIVLPELVVVGRFATLDESVGQPVGAPSCIDMSPIARLNDSVADRVTAVDFRAGQSEEEYRVAASLRKAEEAYAIAAYSLNPGNNASSSDDGEDPETPDPLAELLDEILEPPTPEKDPNELELPLEPAWSAGAEQLTLGQPVGAPDWFGAHSEPPQAMPENDFEEALELDAEDEPSAPVTREINRISERVEHILSSALARPAPAIDFSEALAEISERSRQRKAEKDAAAERLPSQALEDNLARSGERDGGLSMAEYKVQFEIFEGPLDLLLYLVRKQEVDIYEVNLTQIAGEFIKYIEMMRRFDLEVAGEFLVMASTLMYIKSKELLPVEQQSQLDDEEEEDDPRWELIRQLVEYKKFKDAAANFKRLELAQDDVFPRNPAKPEFPVQEVKPNVSVFDLIGAVNKILERIDSREEREIFADRWTVSEKIEVIRAEIEQRESVKFTELFEDALSRTEVVATFLAVLELIKLKVIVVEQPTNFSDIEIRKSPPGHTLNLDEAQEELALEGAGSEYDTPVGGQE